jgi:hypothetical protein
MVRSTDNGNSWDYEPTLPPEPFVFHLAADRDRFFSGTQSSFFVSGDAGATWNCVDTNRMALSFLPLWDTILVGAGFGISRSTDGGGSWIHVDFDPGNNVHSLVSDGNLVFAGTSRGLYRSSDHGSTWHEIGFRDTTILTMAHCQGSLFVSTFSGPGMEYPSGGYWSTDNGQTWTRNDTLNAIVLFAERDLLFSVFQNNLIGLSSDGGASWRNIIDDLSGSCYDIAVNGTYVFVATSAGTYRRPLSELVTWIRQTSENVSPTEIALYQNYPNPFNPSTTIEFTVPHSNLVSLRVFDVIGREIATLVSQQMGSGRFRTQWDATGVASGVYLCRLQVGSKMTTRKLIITR